MIDLVNISLQFGGKYLFKDVSFRISSGDKVSLVGANGTGKSSLLKIINGILQPESGRINKQKRISIGYLPQDNVSHSGKTLMDEARSALSDIIKLQEKEAELINALSQESLSEQEKEDLVNQLGDVHMSLQERDSYNTDYMIEKILSGLGFRESDFSRYVNEFSGGWQMRIALAKILITQNDLLLLDEPTNHLDFDSLNWLINFLKGYKGSLLLVSHDKHFVNQVTNRTLEIFMNRFYVYNGSYDDYLRFKTERDKQVVSLYEQQQARIKETQKFIERFRYKATKARQVQSRVKQLEKLELVELPDTGSNIKMRFPEPPPSGRINIQLQGITKKYGQNTVLSNLDFEINRGDKIAFIGPNGAGKSTLAKIIAGDLEVNEGKRILGHNTIISYYAQEIADDLDPDLDVIESVAGINEQVTLGQLRSLLGCFLFSGDDVFKKAGVLSGGEKSRVALARILLTKSNLIILDEPTNHLDISSKEILKKALLDFKGSLVIVSHDIDFLSGVVNKVVEIRDGSVKIYPGDLNYYLSKKADDSLTYQTEKQKPADGISKKDQKRIEAELRQKRYSSTRGIIKSISVLEDKIELLEKRKSELESQISDSKFYEQGAAIIKSVNADYQKVKADIDSALQEWGELSDKLHQIEKDFS
jgi:ATP-binding cassette subfamily F protein 3